MAEARLRAGMLMGVLANGNMDHQRLKSTLKMLDPLAEPGKPESLTTDKVREFFCVGADGVV